MTHHNLRHVAERYRSIDVSVDTASILMIPNEYKRFHEVVSEDLERVIG